MDLESYNKSFEEQVITYEEEVDARLREFRQKCARDFIDRLNRSQREWETVFHELLNKSQQETKQTDNLTIQNGKGGNLFGLNSNALDSLSFTQPQQDTIVASVIGKPPEEESKVENKNDEKPPNKESVKDTLDIIKPPETQVTQTVAPELKPLVEPNQLSKQDDDDEFNDPVFSNSITLKDFIRIHDQLERSRSIYVDINTDPSLKPFKNEINLFIRTQINAISNSDSEHLNTKIRHLVNLFTGNNINFQERTINASRHPQGQMFAMDLAAQTFVTVGTRLVNSVPAIAKSMAIVINGIIKSNLPLFKDLVMGHLQERCPYLIPMYPRRKDFHGQQDQEIKYKIACGYSFDSKTRSLEAEEKYLARMRSMVLIYACILIQDNIGQAWSWLASFLSLKPRPVITATILQAFLQEASKLLSTNYGRQYKKVVDFIKIDYIKMIEEVTTKVTEKQSLIKLKNLLSDESNLLAPPSVGSIFGAIRFS